MKILVIGGFITAMGMLPVYVYSTMVQPQLDELKYMYSNVDQTAQEISSGTSYQDTSTYKSAKALAGNR